MKDVVLDLERHIYTNVHNGLVYESVTTFISQFKKKFDAEKHAKRVADREGVTTKEILQRWKDTADTACTRGTNIHLVMENYLKDKVIPKEHTEILESFIQKTKGIIKSNSIVLSEEIVYKHDLLLAGTADLIVENGNTFNVMDFKTNKKFNFQSNYNEYFYEPIDHLQICEFTTYTIQMSIYAYMYELLTGKKCSGLNIYYLREFKDKKFWQEIPCMYIKDTIESLFRHRSLKLLEK